MPNRKPTALKKLQGTANKPVRDRLRQYEPQPETSLDVIPPEWMSPSQRDGWVYVMRHAPRGLLAGLDQGMLVGWVLAEDMQRQAAMKQAEIDRGSQLPLLTKTKRGDAVASPYVKIILHCTLVMARACAELGFSPASRPRIQLIPQGAFPALIDGDLDPWDELARDAG